MKLALSWISSNGVEAGSTKVAYDSISESGWWAIAACKTEISSYNSSIAPYHGQALGEVYGIKVSG